MKNITAIQSDSRIRLIDWDLSGGGACKVRVPSHNKPAFVIFSRGGGWDHVSVSFHDRCPTWDEMCYIKDLFFEAGECVMQLHPAKKDYINMHPYVLHLWRPQQSEIPMPPKAFV